MLPGYDLDGECWLDLSGDGALYMVADPFGDRAYWREIGFPMSEDAEPKTPPPGVRALFEMLRRSRGVPE